MARKNKQHVAPSRDVHRDQQLTRSTIGKQKTMTSRTLFSLFVGLLAGLLMWALLSTAAALGNSFLAVTSPDSTPAPEVVETTAPDVGYEQYRDANYTLDTAYGDDVPLDDIYVRNSTGERVLEPIISSEYHKTHGNASSGSNSPIFAASQFFIFTWLKFLISLFTGLFVFSILYAFMRKNLQSQNSMNDTSDINQYMNDQHIQQAHEIQRNYDWFPDVGAHAPVQVSSMISHMALVNKGLKPIEFARRADADIKDADGEILYFKGEILRDEDGEPVVDTVPMIDEKFMDELWDASGLPRDKKSLLPAKDDAVAYRTRFNPTKIPYNPKNETRGKLKDADTIADMINKYWTMPEYEPQRPGGAYIVDTEPVNTMVLAITRAGKGQLIIEPTLDMWTRETEPNNMVINDPKGELLRKFYVRGTVRGFQIIQFNLINAMKTDIYNPLGIAAEAAREGDFTKCAQYVKNIAGVFFPLDGAEDPVWPNAANNAFQRAAYGLIDYYLEEEKELRIKAERVGLDPQTLETEVDRLWGKVTLYNCYQLFVQLTSKKAKNPCIEFKQRAKNGDFDVLKPDENPDALPPNRQPMTDEEYNEAKERVTKVSELWEDKPEADLLTLFFNATAELPANQMRKLVADSNNALRAMSGAEKMMASVYGIAITAMSFFTDPTISTLTSGTPSQNVDLGGLSFPRRLGVRFNADFIKKYALLGLQARWDSFEDKKFEKNLGKEFYHEDIISREGWAMYYFKGKYEKDIAYVRLQIANPATGSLVKTFYFEFKKSYQKSLDGRYYMTDPVTGEKIVNNGIMVELRQGKTATGEIRYKKAKTVFAQEKVVNVMYNPVKERVQTQAIIRTAVRYSEKPKMVFLVTPPHLMQYAKLILILITQLVNFNFDKSYMTKSNQKPLYKTRFMLDELGNLQSEGHGIANFQTMLSIGLGQDQQFTIILQTLQQLRDVYGESVDKIVQGNAQPLTAKIATPYGWKRMGDIRVGDKVLTPHGSITTVTGVYSKGIRRVYKVSLRDGSETEACDQHLWEIERWKSCYTVVNGARVGLNDGKTCERVTEIIDTMELAERVGKNKQISLPRIKPVAYRTANLPVHPYVMGVILGNCHVQPNGVVILTCADAEIIARIGSYGYEIVPDCPNDVDSISYRINGINKVMRELGLAGKRSYEKFVPDKYLHGSIEQRTDLLRGLMDTDGCISVRNEMEFTSSSAELARNVQFLVRSLGGRVDVHRKTNIMYTAPNQKTKKPARDAYRVQNIQLPGIVPFYLSRKVERWRDRTDTSGNRVVSVEYVRDDAVQCIRVADERHLYLTDDFIPTHNTSNIVFLKSTDDSMLDTLQKMSGTRHVVYNDSKTITKDLARPFMANEDKVSYTMTAKEMPVISYNDMAFITPKNSIVFRAGDSPIWNCNETILLMSHKLFENTIIQPGKEYTMQTIPTLSSALEFDVRKNQPDFIKMWEKRRDQAVASKQAQENYQNAYGYDDHDIAQLDPDVWADDIISLINSCLTGPIPDDLDDDEFLNYDPDDDPFTSTDYEENTEQLEATAQAMATAAERNKKLYAGGMLAKSDIIANGHINQAYESAIVEAFKETRAYFFKDSVNFMERNGSLVSALDGSILIQKLDDSSDLELLKESAADGDTRIYSDGEDFNINNFSNYSVLPAFYKFLISQENWQFFAGGRFDQEMEKIMKR